MQSRAFRFIFFGVAVLVGFTAGMVYGWVVNPVESATAKPETLRIDYKADYVLMTAELYHAEEDPLLALARLRFFNAVLPMELLNATIAYAETQNYAKDDIQHMRNLASGIQQILPAAE